MPPPSILTGHLGCITEYPAVLASADALRLRSPSESRSASAGLPTARKPLDSLGSQIRLRRRRLRWAGRHTIDSFHRYDDPCTRRRRESSRSCRRGSTLRPRVGQVSRRYKRSQKQNI